jgi:hypothetical protein
MCEGFCSAGLERVLHRGTAYVKTSQKIIQMDTVRKEWSG